MSRTSILSQERKPKWQESKTFWSVSIISSVTRRTLILNVWWTITTLKFTTANPMGSLMAASSHQNTAKLVFKVNPYEFYLVTSYKLYILCYTASSKLTIIPYFHYMVLSINMLFTLNATQVNTCFSHKDHFFLMNCPRKCLVSQREEILPSGPT